MCLHCGSFVGKPLVWHFLSYHWWKMSFVFTWSHEAKWPFLAKWNKHRNTNNSHMIWHQLRSASHSLSSLSWSYVFSSCSICLLAVHIFWWGGMRTCLGIAEGRIKFLCMTRVEYLVLSKMSIRHLVHDTRSLKSDPCQNVHEHIWSTQNGFGLGQINIKDLLVWTRYLHGCSEQDHMWSNIRNNLDQISLDILLLLSLSH